MIKRPSPTGPPGAVLRCGVALGSNVGDRLAHLQVAAQALAHLADFSQPVLKSPLYETAPVDCAPGTPAFYNAVMEIGFFGTPQSLLERLQAVERALGRPEERSKNAPRVLDLDLLYADDLVVHGEDLELPHPRLGWRRFVLEPLAAIRPSLRLPGAEGTVRELLAALPDAEPPLRRLDIAW